MSQRISKKAVRCAGFIMKTLVYYFSFNIMFGDVHVADDDCKCIILKDEGDMHDRCLITKYSV